MGSMPPKYFRLLRTSHTRAQGCRLTVELMSWAMWARPARVFFCFFGGSVPSCGKYSEYHSAGLGRGSGRWRREEGFLPLSGLEEGVSTRLLIYTGQLISRGIEPRRAADIAIVGAVSDDATVQEAIADITDAVLPA